MLFCSKSKVFESLGRQNFVHQGLNQLVVSVHNCLFIHFSLSSLLMVQGCTEIATKGENTFKRNSKLFPPELPPSFYLIRYQSSFFYLWEVTKLSESAICFFEQTSGSKKWKTCQIASFLQSFHLNFFQQVFWFFFMKAWLHTFSSLCTYVLSKNCKLIPALKTCSAKMAQTECSCDLLL